MEKFEEYLKELEEVINLLENGKLSLADSIEKYKRGLELSEFLRKALEEAKEIITSKIVK